jgi:two-component system nitrogen regulation sensor histidine kinase NtrY
MLFLLKYAVVITVVVIVPLVAYGAHSIISRVAELHAVLGNALSAFRDGDFSLRLAARGDRELAELKQLYNELADAVRADRRSLHEKEVLLDTMLQRTPVAVVLVNAAERIVYSNGAARELFAAGARLNDRLLADVDVVAKML